MVYSTTYGKFQSEMKDYFKRTGSRLQFPEMIRMMYEKDLLDKDVKAINPKEERYELTLKASSMTDEEFDRFVDQMPLDIPEELTLSKEVSESSMIPEQRDVFLIRHPRYTRPAVHSHNYFEVDFVSSGQADFIFEGEKRQLHEGECAIIAPYSEHDFIINDDSLVFCLMIRRSTFNTAFFGLRSGKDLLSYFFQSILKDERQANYLLFIAKNNSEIRSLFRGALIESIYSDDYSNSCLISLVNLIFANLLRNYSQTLKYYDYSMGSDFSLVLQYIEHNYNSLTLSELAEIFHYSEPYLSTLIRENTGRSFTDLIRELRLADAKNYLLNTSKKVGEIAELVGYNSADHFSRVFRSVYHESPASYRKKHRDDSDNFIPFSSIKN